MLAYSLNKRAKMALCLTWLQDKWPLGGAIFYLSAVIWKSQLDTFNQGLSQWAFSSRRRDWK